jgi:methylmalonyl-CoA mutase, N-terminal domain
MERQAEAIFARIKDMSSDGSMTSGILRGIEDGWFMAEIADAAFVYQQQLEKGEKKIVGVNCHTGSVEEPLEILRVSHEVEREQKRELVQRKSGRDGTTVRNALARMLDVARSDDNVLPAMLDAVRAEATLGEICGALRDEWGSYMEPARF